DLICAMLRGKCANLAKNRRSERDFKTKHQKQDGDKNDCGIFDCVPISITRFKKTPDVQNQNEQ
ncbi:MAG: hypothetical protein WC466_05915, partial [Candidatus Izemoplasmatales bacterium]